MPKTLESVFLPRYESLKLNHDNSYLMKSEDTVEDPLMDVQFYIKSQSFFHFVLQSIYCFLLQKKLKSVFLPRYESLKQNHDNSYLMKSEDTVEDPLSVDGCSILYKEPEFFSFRVTVHLLFFYCKRSLNLYFYNAMNL